MTRPPDWNEIESSCSFSSSSSSSCNSLLLSVIVGLYPVIGWKVKDELVFVAEGFASDTGKCLEWTSSIGKCHITDLQLVDWSESCHMTPGRNSHLI